MDKKILTDLKHNLLEELNFRLERFDEIHKGFGNKLYSLISNTSAKLLLKVYYSKNAGHLEREFHALTFLNSKNFTHIPKAYFKNNELNYAIYSYESGDEKKVNDINKEDISQMTDFLASLYDIQEATIYKEFANTIQKRRSINDYIRDIHVRIAAFKKYVLSKDAHPKIKELNLSVDLLLITQGFIDMATQHLSHEELDRGLEIHDFRLALPDFGIHNMLWDANNQIIFLDFEYFELDDPLRVVSEFIVHDQMYGLSDELKHEFLMNYLAKTKLPKTAFKRINLLIKLFYIEWISFFMESITPKGIERMRFADTHFDLDKYIDGQINKIKQRIKDIPKYESDYLASP